MRLTKQSDFFEGDQTRERGPEAPYGLVTGRKAAHQFLSMPMNARTAIAVLAVVTAACGGDPASPGTTSTTPPAPPPVELPTDRLLTDAELVTSLDSLAPTEPSERVTWAKGAAHPIRSLTYDGDFSDLDFLATALQGKRLVQLGESGHGVSEFSLAKVRLIKFLHEQLGYDVIAFESSLFACWDADARAESLGGMGLLQSCPFTVWHVAEVLPLLEYVAATKKTARPLTLAGFDVQLSTLSDLRRPPTVRRLFRAAGDTVAGDHWAALDSTFWAAYRTARSADDMAAYIRTNYDALTGTPSRRQWSRGAPSSKLRRAARRSPSHCRACAACVRTWTSCART